MRRVPSADTSCISTQGLIVDFIGSLRLSQSGTGREVPMCMANSLKAGRGTPRSTSAAPFVIEGPGVPIEPEARDQLAAVARRPDCVCAIGQPDLHAGPGQPIGASFAMTSVWPRLVGSDAGCGVRITVVRSKAKGDKLRRRVDAAFSLRMRHSVEVHEAAWRLGVRGLAEIGSLPDRLRAMAALEPLDALGPSGNISAMKGIDSIGGGNHFAEISKVSEIVDSEESERLGINAHSTVVVVHSGSRGVGAAVGERYGMAELSIGQHTDYMADLAGAVRFAAANRFLLSWRLMVALGATRPPLGGFDVVHNTVVPFEFDGTDTFLHRKGCAPAEEGQPTVVLGSRGTPTWIMRGEGKVEFLSSVAHGAGRRLTRTDARSRFRAMYKRKELERTEYGGVVFCDRKELLYEEHPEAYKRIGPVIDAIEEHGVASRVAALIPQITVKR